jgi:hypothetical protein
MPVQLVVLVNESSMPLTSDRLKEVARALQIQVVRDFEPIWNESAHVSVADSANVPAGASPIRIVDRSAELGVHSEENGRASAIVRATSDWTVTASHELLEMLVDPEGNRTIEGRDIDPDHRGRRVEYLVEVCDPCQVYDYTVGTVPVSNFVTQEYFREESSAGKVDFLGRLTSPLQVPKGCQLSWWDVQYRSWHQWQANGRVVRDAPTADAGSRRDDRDQALSAVTGEFRHDLQAARRAMFREPTEAALQELFARDARMRHIIRRAEQKHGWKLDETEQAVREYRRHLLLRYLHPGLRLAAMNKLGDLLWHEHIIDTDKYRQDCERIFGGVLDHQPFYEQPRVLPAEDPRMQEASKLYTHEFGAAPPELAQTSH